MSDLDIVPHRPGAATAPGRANRWSELRRSWPLAWRDLATLAITYAVITAVMVAVGALVVGPFDSSIGAIDRRVARWFEDGRTPRLDGLSYWGSMLSETAVKIVLTAIAAAVMIAVWRRWNDALLVAVALILEACIFLTVTLIVGRHRPDVTRLDSSPVDSSFPSGHVAAAVVYGAFAIIVAQHTVKRWPRVIAVVVAVAVSVIVAWARMYRGMHHLSDVLAGIVLGLVSIWVTWRVMQRAEERAVGRAPQDLAT